MISNDHMSDSDMKEKYEALKTEKNLIILEMKKLELAWGTRVRYETGHPVEIHINGTEIERCNCKRQDGPCINFDGQDI